MPSFSDLQHRRRALIPEAWNTAGKGGDLRTICASPMAVSSLFSSTSLSSIGWLEPAVSSLASGRLLRQWLGSLRIGKIDDAARGRSGLTRVHLVADLLSRRLL